MYCSVKGCHLKQMCILKQHGEGVSGNCHNPARIKVLPRANGQHTWIGKKYQDKDFWPENLHCNPMWHSLKQIVWYFDGGRGIVVLNITHEGKDPVGPMIWWLTKALAILLGTMITTDPALDGWISWILFQQ
jgi:hypothetical protein